MIKKSFKKLIEKSLILKLNNRLCIYISGLYESYIDWIIELNVLAFEPEAAGI